MRETVKAGRLRSFRVKKKRMQFIYDTKVLSVDEILIEKKTKKPRTIVAITKSGNIFLSDFGVHSFFNDFNKGEHQYIYSPEQLMLEYYRTNERAGIWRSEKVICNSQLTIHN